MLAATLPQITSLVTAPDTRNTRECEKNGKAHKGKVVKETIVEDGVAAGK